MVQCGNASQFQVGAENWTYLLLGPTAAGATWELVVAVQNVPEIPIVTAGYRTLPSDSTSSEVQVIVDMNSSAGSNGSIGYYGNIWVVCNRSCALGRVAGSVWVLQFSFSAQTRSLANSSYNFTASLQCGSLLRESCPSAAKGVCCTRQLSSSGGLRAKFGAISALLSLRVWKSGGSVLGPQLLEVSLKQHTK